MVSIYAESRYTLGERAARNLRFQSDPKLAFTGTSGKDGLVADSTPQQLMYDLVSDGFWRLVDKTGECWIFTGVKDNYGYGSLFLGNRRVRAHRLSYMLVHGAIPDGLSIMHVCDVRDCVRPDHLKAGTHQENMRDMQRKGRNRSGNSVTNPKLTEEQVIEIRRRYKAGGVTQAALASEYGMHPLSICNIVNRISWKRLPE